MLSQAKKSKISCEYFPQLDRFLCHRQEHHPELYEILESPIYNGLEYFRYIPGEYLSLKDIDNYLASYPQELCCEITNDCNIRCRVCIADAPVTPSTFLTLQSFSEIVTKLKTDRITITGGEPTLHSNLSKIIEIASWAAKIVVLSTNGLETEIIEESLQGIDNVILAVSLHGIPEIHDFFTNQTGACELACKTVTKKTFQNVVCQIHTTITPETLEGLPALLDMVAEMEVSEHRLNLVKPQGRGAKREVSFQDVSCCIKNKSPQHKVVVKRVDQPFYFLNCFGELEVRHVRKK